MALTMYFSPARSFLSVVVILCVVAGVLLTPVAVTAQDDNNGIPPVPAAYYGGVTADGDPAPADLEVTAELEGETYGSITTDGNGDFGGPTAVDDKLLVDPDEAPANETVIFFVDGEQADETAEWESGANEEVQLTVDSLSDNEADEDGGEDNDDSNGAEGDGQGGGAAPPASGGSSEDDATEEGTEQIEAPDGAAVERAEEAAVVADPDTGESSVMFSEEAAVERITFSSATEGSVTVSELDTEPRAIGPSPGASASVIEITVPDEAADQAATIRHRLSQGRITEIDAAADLRLNRYDVIAGEWQGLETAIIDENDERVIIEAETPGFSTFSVSAVSEPEATIAVPDVVTPGDEFILDGSDSRDRYGDVIAYEWTVNGEKFTGETATASLTTGGEYTVELTVENDAGETDTATATVVVAEEEPTEDQSGLGVPVALVALLIAAVLVFRR